MAASGGAELIIERAKPLERAAELVAAALVAADRERGYCRLSIAGGSVIKALLSLRPLVEAQGDAWGRIRLTWVDERCVDFASEESNRGEAHRVGGLASHPVGEELPLWLDGETPPEALDRVQKGLRARFDDGLDVNFLGMGPDGHIASLFPQLPPVRADRVAYIDHSPKPPPRRTTLTRDVIATAPVSVLLAPGESKREALGRLLSGDDSLPAYGLPGLTIITDIDIA